MVKFLKILLYPILSSQVVFKLLTKDSLFVFTFHEVSKNPAQQPLSMGLHTPLENFAQQIAFIQKHFQLLAPPQLKELQSISGATAMVTFDDAYPTWFTELIPWLTKAKIPALFFTNGAVLKGEELAIFHPTEKNYLEVRPQDVQLKITGVEQKLVEEEGIYWGNHLWNHFNALHLSSEQLREQYQKNENFLKQSKNFLPYFAYPFGQPKISFSTQTHAQILGLGAEKIFTAYDGKNSDPGQFVLKRFSLPAEVKTEKEMIIAMNYSLIRAFILGLD